MVGFSWENHKKKTEERMLVRLESLARVNPDFKVVHPELVKELLNKAMINKVETKKYIQKILLKKFKYGEVPKPSIIIKRLNRVVG